MSPQKKPSKPATLGFSIDDIPQGVSPWSKQSPRKKDFKSEAEYEAASVAHLVEQSLDEVMDKGRIPEPVDMGRVVNLRFSSLPFCNVRWFINLPGSLGSERPTDFGYRYFTKVGHAVHDVFQRAVEASEKIHFLKDYVCTSCKKRYVLKAKTPTKCTCGSKLFKSEEHEVLWRGAIGHVDEIVVPFIHRLKEVYLLDYKTTSLFAMNKEDTLAYVNQIRSYGVALSDAGYRVLGMSLIYIPRDNPFKKRLSVVKWDPKIEARQRNWMQYWLENHTAGTNVKTLQGALKLLDNRPCKDSQPSVYKGCPFTDFCAGNCRSRPPEMEKRVRQSFEKVRIWLPLKQHKQQ